MRPNINDFWNKMLDAVFDKKYRDVLLLTLFGFILRLIAARNIGVSADDVNHAVRPIGIFNSNKLVIWDQSTALWYYIQGVFYNLFGATTIASRFASVVFGTLLIIAVFIVAKKITKSHKAALFSALLITLSPLLIKSTLPEMDVTVAFFLMLAAYFLFNYVEGGKRRNLYISAIIIGTAVMIKLYVLFFAASFILFILYKEFFRGKTILFTIKSAFIFGIIICVLVTPTLAHNYLLYRDKGFMDLIFTNNLGIGVENAKQYYDWGAGWLPYSDYSGFFFGHQRNFDPTWMPGALIVLGFLLKGDPAVFLIGLVGILFIFRKNKDYFIFSLIVALPAFVYLGSQIPLAKHFVWMLALLAPGAGLALDKLTDKYGVIKIKYIVWILIIFNLVYLGMPRDIVNSHFYGESSFNQMVDYKNNNIRNDSLVVVDSRIYRGSIHWGLAGTNYIEAAQFPQLAQGFNKENLQRITTYYVECVSDDCGWGTVAQQPDFNKSMEDVTAWFANNSQSHVDFDAPVDQSYYLPIIGQKNVIYRVYKADIAIDPAALEAVKQVHVWYLYPEAYDRRISQIFDDYKVFGIGRLVSKFAWIIFYLELIISFLVIPWIFYLFLKEN